MINTSKPTGSLANGTRIVSYETWASIPTTWTTETRTWDETATIMTNGTKPTSSMTNVAKP